MQEMKAVGMKNAALATDSGSYFFTFVYTDLTKHHLPADDRSNCIVQLYFQMCGPAVNISFTM